MAETNIWQQTTEKYRAAADALHAHLDRCSQCDALQGIFCEGARGLITACLASPRYPTGLDVQQAGQCPMHGKGPLACSLCPFGHLTECHAPDRCEIARCSRWEKQRAANRAEARA